MFEQFLGCSYIRTFTFKLLSGPFQHLSPFVYVMNWYEFSNFSHSLPNQITRKKRAQKVKQTEIDSY